MFIKKIATWFFALAPVLFLVFYGLAGIVNKESLLITDYIFFVLTAGVIVLLFLVFRYFKSIIDKKV